MKRSFYSIRAIVWIAFLGPSPLAALLAISNNFKMLGKRKAAVATLIFGILLTVVVYVLYAWIPDWDFSIKAAILTGITYFMFALAAGLFAAKTQDKDIEEWLQRGGEKKGLLHILGLILLSLLISLAILTMLLIVFPQAVPPGFGY